MTFKRPKARILERTITAGNGPFALAGAVDDSYNTFSAFMAVGDTTYVSVVEPGVAFWTGIGTYSAANQITLTTVEESKGIFGSGTKEIMSGALASSGVLREDIAGAIVTGGTSAAYTVASYRKYDTLAQLDGNVIAFTPHVTNALDAALSVDGTDFKPLRLAPGVGLQTNTLVKGTPYTAYYNHGDQAYYLHNLGGNTYGVPLGAGMEYWGDITPNSAFAFPLGQALPRTGPTAKLFELFGTKYGSGDGLTTFNIPGKAGRASFMRESSPSLLTSAFFGGNSTLLGAIGGSESHALTASQQASMSVSGVQVSGSMTGNASPFMVDGFANNFQFLSTAGGTSGFGSGGSSVRAGSQASAPVSVSGQLTGGTGTAVGGNNAHNNMPPAIICNSIIRII